MEIFEEDGHEATVSKVNNNLVGRGCIAMLGKNEITQDKGLSYLMFLKQKGIGKVKARACADGRPQKEYVSKGNSSSRTVSIYALMARCVMDAIEGRKIVTSDIPGASLQSDCPEDDDWYMRFEELIVDTLRQINPTCKKKRYLYGKLAKAVCGKLAKAVYGTLLERILSYNKQSKQLELCIDDAMTFMIWARYYFEEQTKTLPDTLKLKDLRNHNVVEQDNTSAIQLEQNGKGSSTKRTRHINIRYFYVTDKIKEGDVSVIYKPTHYMVSDYLTKPLQGWLFAKRRDTLLGLYKGDYTSFYVKYKRLKNGV